MEAVVLEVLCIFLVIRVWVLLHQPFQKGMIIPPDNPNSASKLSLNKLQSKINYKHSYMKQILQLFGRARQKALWKYLILQKGKIMPTYFKLLGHCRKVFQTSFCTTFGTLIHMLELEQYSWTTFLQGKDVYFKKYSLTIVAATQTYLRELRNLFMLEILVSCFLTVSRDARQIIFYLKSF